VGKNKGVKMNLQTDCNSYPKPSQLINYAIESKALVSVWHNNSWCVSRSDDDDLINAIIDTLSGDITLIFINNRYGHTGHIGSANIKNNQIISHTDNTWFDDFQLRVKN